MVSLSEAREFAIEKRKGNPVTDFLRNFSFIFTWIFVNTGVSANKVTFIGLMFGIGGSLMFISTSIYWWFAGWIMFVFLLIMDCSDGEVSALNDNRTEFGGFFDEVTHPITNSTLVLFSAIGAYRITGEIVILVAGSVGGILYMLSSLLSLKLSKSEEGKSSDSPSVIKWREAVTNPLRFLKHGLLFSPGGLLHPLMAFMLIDAFLLPGARAYYPVLASAAGIVIVLKRFRNLKSSLK